MRIESEYEDAIPVDVFDGQPLRYERKDEGFLSYPVGQDLDDDKGRRAVGLATAKSCGTRCGEFTRVYGSLPIT